MYHINNEGKIYPCRAKVLNCPYGENNHAETKKDLYRKQISMYKDVEIPEDAQNEMESIGRLKSLYSLSSELERSSYPVEIIVKTLEDNIRYLERDVGGKKFNMQWLEYEEEVGEAYAEAVSWGGAAPHHLKDTPLWDAYQSAYVYKPFKEDALSTRNPIGEEVIMEASMLEKSDEFIDYIGFVEFGLNDDNYDGSLRWAKEDFYQFSHDLNTSKLLARPAFYGSTEEVDEYISTMDDDELLSTFDDYLITNDEMLYNVELANNFEYEYRDDLTLEANRNIKKWYDMNKDLYKEWDINTPVRTLLVLKMAKELDERGIQRQDADVKVEDYNQ